jgi:hypothetical protein
MTHSTAALRLVLVPVAGSAGAAAAASSPVRRYRLARMKPPPLPKGAEHLRRLYD